MYLFSLDLHAGISISSNDFSIKIDPQTQESKLITNNDKLSVKNINVAKVDLIENIQLKLTNTSNTTISLEPVKIIIGNELNASEDSGGGFGASFYDYLDPFIIDSATEKGKKVEAELDAGPLELLAKNWFGWTNRFYFESIRFPVNDSSWQYKLVNNDHEAVSPENLFVILESRSKELQPGHSINIDFQYLSEAKSRKLLQNKNIGMQGLLLINLWDWFRSLCFLIWLILDTLFMICGNWGVSIILLALVIRLVTVPITKISLHYQERAIQQQNTIKPLLQDIKNNYSGVELSEQTIKLYEKLNYDHFAPFKSMLGLFIQIPIFIALFNVIGDAWELSNQPFLWITDLAKSDRIADWQVTLPYFGRYLNALPILMALVTFYSTWHAAKTSSNGNISAMTLFGMGGVFFILFYSFPAALVLYWLSSNFFQLLQQMISGKE